MVFSGTPFSIVPIWSWQSSSAERTVVLLAGEGVVLVVVLTVVLAGVLEEVLAIGMLDAFGPAPGG